MICNKQCKAYDDEFYVEYCLILEHHVGEDVAAPIDCPKRRLADAMEMLDNVKYWETCPDEYKARINKLQTGDK